MKLDEKGETDFIHFPIAETRKIMAVMERAEKAADLKALQRTARLLLWIFKTMLKKDGICTSDMSTMFHNGKEDAAIYSADQFNRDYANELKKEPLPEAWL